MPLYGAAQYCALAALNSLTVPDCEGHGVAAPVARVNCERAHQFTISRTHSRPSGLDFGLRAVGQRHL